MKWKHKRQMILLTVCLLFAGITGNASADLIWDWDWDSGTTEGWGGLDGDTQLSVEAGRNGTFGLGAINGPPYTTAVFPILEIAGQDIPPGNLVGNAFGNYLPMTSEIYIDIKRPVGGNSNYVDLWIFGQESTARFVTYPAGGIGTIEDLGDGWYRHHLANRFHLNDLMFPSGTPAGMIQLHWNYNFDASTVPVVFDNFTIDATTAVPEPTSVWLFGFAVAVLRTKRHRTVGNRYNGDGAILSGSVTAQTDLVGCF